MLVLTATFLLLFQHHTQESNRWVAIFRQHLDRYPQMELVDLYKLLYQATCGPAHLVSDSVEVYQEIRAELEGLVAAPEPLTENIDAHGAYMRINLKSFKYYGGDPRQLARIVCNSAKLDSNAHQKLQQRWQLVGQLIRDGLLPFTVAAYEELTDTLQAANFPAVHHSPTYRRMYQPAYRVVARSVWEKAPACRTDL